MFMKFQSTENAWKKTNGLYIMANDLCHFIDNSHRLQRFQQTCHQFPGFTFIGKARISPKHWFKIFSQFFYNIQIRWLRKHIGFTSNTPQWALPLFKIISQSVHQLSEFNSSNPTSNADEHRWHQSCSNLNKQAREIFLKSNNLEAYLLTLPPQCV